MMRAWGGLRGRRRVEKVGGWGESEPIEQQEELPLKKHHPDFSSPLLILLIIFKETESCYVTQADLELLVSCFFFFFF